MSRSINIYEEGVILMLKYIDGMNLLHWTLSTISSIVLWLPLNLDHVVGAEGEELIANGNFNGHEIFVALRH